MADEQVTCKCPEGKRWVWYDVDGAVGWVPWYNADRWASNTCLTAFCHLCKCELGHIIFDQSTSGRTEPTVTPMVPAVTSEAVRGTHFWNWLLRGIERDDAGHVHFPIEHRKIIHAALSGGTVPLAVCHDGVTVAERLSAAVTAMCLAELVITPPGGGAANRWLVHMQAADAGQPREPRHSADTFMAGGYKESGEDD